MEWSASPHEYSVVFSAQSHVVSLPPDVWEAVLERAGDRELAERVAVALSPALLSSHASGVLRSLVCWAQKQTDGATSELTAPAEWSQLYPWLFRSALPRVTVKSTRLVDLTSVVLVALDSHAYALATEQPVELQRNLQGVILRQHDTFADELNAPTFRIVMAEPVTQGLVTSITCFNVLPPTMQHLPASPSATSEEDDLDISEAFLATTLMGAELLSRSTGAESTANGIAQQENASVVSKLDCAALDTFIEDFDLHPMPLEDEDNECRLYLRPSELAALGLFSGARVVLTGQHARLARVYTLPSFVEPPRSAIGLLPPSFFFNLLPDSDKGRVVMPLQIQLLREDDEIRIPTASMVTVSRICSPLTVDRQYQPLCLHGLKCHFEMRQRCLRTDDIIAVAVDMSQARQLSSLPADKEESEPTFDNLPGASSTKHTDVAYFQIVALDVDVSALPATATKAFGDRVARGEFGAYIDPQTTKLVQSGTRQSLVPGAHATAYLCGQASTISSFADQESPLLARVNEHVRAALCSGSHMYDLPLSMLLKSTARGSGKRNLAKKVALATGLHYYEIDCYDLIGETDVKTEGTLRARFEKAISCAPCVLVLAHLEALARKTQAIEQGQDPAMVFALQDCLEVVQGAWQHSGFPVFVIATTSVAEKIPSSLLSCFKTEFSIEAAQEAERRLLLESLLASDSLAPDVSLSMVAMQTAALVAADLADLVARARFAALQRVYNTVKGLLGEEETTMHSLSAAGIQLSSQDFARALDEARTSYSESIGAPKIPNVTWDDVGGLASVKREILDTVQLPLEQPQLFAEGLKKRSGILLYGPPGTGKTLLAKAVATSCSLNFFSVKGPELLNMYIGESEANVRRVFQRARDAKPCIIFFDELDSVAPKRGNQGDSGGVMDRIVSQLLAELDGMSEGSRGADVFVIGATNRPDLLDPALLRPGRFDRMLYLGVSDSHEAQLRILEALTRRFRLAPETDLVRLAEQCPFHYTGADFYALCSDAMLKAMSRKAEEVEQRIVGLNARPPYASGEKAKLTPQYYLAELATSTDTEILVSQADFELALQELKPSVSEAEMQHYALVQQRFSSKSTAEETELNGTTGANGIVKRKGKGRSP